MGFNTHSLHLRCNMQNWIALDIIIRSGIQWMQFHFASLNYMIASHDRLMQLHKLSQLFPQLKWGSILEVAFLRSHQSWALQLDYSKLLQVWVEYKLAQIILGINCPHNKTTAICYRTRYSWGKFLKVNLIINLSKIIIKCILMTFFDKEIHELYNSW